MSEKENKIDIAKSMNSIMNGQAKLAGAEIVAVAKVIKAAEILSQTGFEDEAQQVLATLKDNPLTKEASAKTGEEILFEVTEQ
jgi:hypothetical protein